MLNKILSIYKDRKVLITGITGFKGSWMCQWLINLGADVYGLAIEPPTNPSLFERLNLEERCKWYNVDIRNYSEVKKLIAEVKPEFIFHMAAQSLIRVSYDSPLETLDTNIMGTVNLFEAVRQSQIKTNIIVITSDKCYENQEWLFGYRENDPLGGFDPYSASKGAVEIIVSSYRRSFFDPINLEKHGVNVCSVRAGNVIGGGDWATDRIVPDCIRFLEKQTPIRIRNPHATRPWQHVLEPVGAYLILGAKLHTMENNEREEFCSAFNFGPLVSSNKSVELLVREVIKYWGNGELIYDTREAVHEANLLNISIDKAYHLLHWLPAWGFEETVKNTVFWYQHNLDNPKGIEDFTNKQINKYSDDFHFSNSNM